MNTQIIQRLREKLIKWGKTELRAYPWRYQNDPYRILVSEFMLHRTQTRQVLPVYNQFIAQYPSLADYAGANRAEAESMLVSLGLNWRITGMLNALDILWKEYGGVPLSYENLIAVEGIGQYIAGATICFTQNQPLTIVDSNIVRVLGRVHGLDLHGEARRKKEVVETIEKSMDSENPRDFYYAIIDLAHKICQPRNPACIECPLRDVPCQYANSKKQSEEKQV